MIAMIFEFTFDPTKPDVHDEYLTASAELRSLLSEVDGFEGVERYQSCSDPDKYVAAWRNTPAHRRVQGLGRNRYFTEYRLRMADVTRDYSGTDRTQAPVDSGGAHDTGSTR